MAGDLDLLPGKWTVRVKGWTWEYEFSRDGRVTWRDLRSSEKGSGNWAATSKLVNMWWHGSATRESWQRPLTVSNDHTWYQSSYYQGKYRIEKSASAGPTPPGPAPTPSAPTDQDQINQAWNASRASVRFALDRLKQLQMQIQIFDGMHSGASAATALRAGFRRDIAVISRRLLVPDDPMSPFFRDGLAKAISLIEQNLGLPKSITSARGSGKCANPEPAFAWTTVGRRPPDTELCTSWFESAADLKRDVITHEYFHTLGLGDIHVGTTIDALGNANTLAQVVALINDRTRQVNSDGNEPAVPPLPSP
jgi:hypothetical protein